MVKSLAELKEELYLLELKVRALQATIRARVKTKKKRKPVRVTSVSSPTGYTPYPSILVRTAALSHSLGRFGGVLIWV
jgi:hypothetical protein